MELAEAAKLLGLYNGKYVFMSLDLYTWESSRSMPDWLAKYPTNLLEGWFDISAKSTMPTSSKDTQHVTFLRDLQQRLLQHPFYVQVNQV